MIYWMLKPDVENFDGIRLIPGIESVDFPKRFVGKSLAEEWKVKSFSRYDEDPLGDFPSTPTGSPPVFSPTAWTALASLIEKDVEALPSYIGKEKFYVINILTLNDCLDFDKSDSIISNGQLLHIYYPVIKTECVGNHHIFKIQQLPFGPTFVSDTFRQTVVEHKLEGLLFPD